MNIPYSSRFFSWIFNNPMNDVSVYINSLYISCGYKLFQGLETH